MSMSGRYFFTCSLTNTFVVKPDRFSIVLHAKLFCYSFGSIILVLYYAHIVVASFTDVFLTTLSLIHGAINITFDTLYICEHSDMNTDTSKANKDSKGSKKDTDDAATGGSVMDVGDTSRDIRDTGDVARASIAKGRGSQRSRTAADIAKGQIESDEPVIQGTAAATTTATPNTTEDDNTSKDKVISSGTSLNEDKSVDKADIYSTEETGTRTLTGLKKNL